MHKHTLQIKSNGFKENDRKFLVNAVVVDGNQKGKLIKFLICGIQKQFFQKGKILKISLLLHTFPLLQVTNPAFLLEILH